MGKLTLSVEIKLLLAFLLFSVSMPVTAQERTVASGESPAVEQQPQSDIAQEVDEDFVIASLLISDPGGALYSRLGHAALHMQCPEHDLDYVFTYASEDILKNPFKFLSGKLRMGLVAIAPEEYLKDYSTQGRGVREYTLNLPIEDKRNLWRILDNHLMEGMDLEFDYIRRGCAHSTLAFLKEGLGGGRLVVSQWPEYFDGASRREITYEHLKEHKWTTFLMHFICNGIIDHLNITDEQKAIIPADLPFILSHASVDGVPVIDSEPQELLPTVWQPKSFWLTPMLAAILLFVLTVVCILLRSSVMDYVLLGIQSLLGIIAVWLVFFSSLVGTEWSWLLIPFNPLPLIFWKWRRRWALPYAIVLFVWSGFMLLWPHLLTDGAYIIVTNSLIASYASIYNNFRRISSL